MDERVEAAVARWPGVPAVFGWLSLSERGQWRLHEDGSGWTPGEHETPPEAAGASIESSQIRSFIDRNYAGDAQGRWYFQNGPQRVYVRLDAAPYILHVDNTSLSFITHNGLAAQQIDAWWIDDHGRLYACTEHGPGLVAGRDTPAVFEALYTDGGEPLLSVLETANFLYDAAVEAREPSAGGAPIVRGVLLRVDEADGKQATPPAPLHFCPASQLPLRLGFSQCPAP